MDKDRKAPQPATADDEAERKKLDLNKDTVSNMEVSPDAADAVKGGQMTACTTRRVE